MSKKYHHLAAQERAVIMVMRTELCSIRAITKKLGRTPGTISREILRTDIAAPYDANLANDQAFAQRKRLGALPSYL